MMQEEMMIPVENGGDDTAMSESNPTEDIAATASLEEPVQTHAELPEETTEQACEEDVYMPVFKGQTIPIRANDRQEITTLLQLGMKHREFLPTYERLAKLTADVGGRSVTSFIENLCDRQEDLLREQAIAAYGEEAGQRFYEMERESRQHRYEHTQRQLGEELEQLSAMQEEKLASDFLELQAEYPEYTDFHAVEREIVETALEKNISLLDARNRFVLAEQKRREQQARSEQQAADQTTGSLSQNGDDAPSAMDAFLTGLHRRT